MASKLAICMGIKMSTSNIYLNENLSKITFHNQNNSNYQEKIKQIDFSKISTDKSLDSFEKGGNVTDILYELYPKYKIVNEMPKSIFGDKFGYEMQKNISKTMEDFYAGKISQSELEDFFEECYSAQKEYRTHQRQTTGKNTDDNKQILGEIYEMFAKENARAARNANSAEGRAMNETYGGREDDSVYYNSDYYYQCDERKEMLQKLVGKLADKYEIPTIDTDEIEKNSIFTLDGGFDFNSMWNYNYRNQIGRSSMEDESMIPPKNFKFFYKENSFQDQASLWVSLNGKITDRQFPFSIDQNGSMKGQLFYLNDLVGDSLQKENSGNEEYMDFINNIALFTRWYSFCTKINNVFGNYVSPKS